MSAYKSNMTTIRTEVYEKLIDSYIDYLEETLDMGHLNEEEVYEFVEELGKYHEEKENLYAPIKTFQVYNFVCEEYLGEIELPDSTNKNTTITLNGTEYWVVSRLSFDYDIIVTELNNKEEE